MVDLLEFGDEDGGHFLGDVPDDALQFPLGGEHIVPLGGKVGIALVHPGVFLDGAQVGGAQGGDFPLQFSNAAIACRDGLDLPPELPGGAGGQTVGIPELVHNLLFLHRGGELLLLQQGAGPLHVQDVLALVLGLPFAQGFGGLGLRPVGNGQLHLALHFLRLGIVFLLPGEQGGNFVIQPGGIRLDGLDQSQLFLPVALHGPAQLPQILNMGQGGGALGVQGGGFGFQGGDAFVDFGGGLHGLRLAALQLGDLPAALLQLLSEYVHLGLLGGVALPVGLAALLQGLQLPAGGLLRFHNGVHHHLVLLLLALEAKHLILCLPKLIPGGGELKLHLIEQPAGFRLLGLGHHFLVLELLFLGGELFQLIGPGEDAGVLVHGAAGHGAAGVHHLAVQGDDLEAAAVFLGHGDGGVHILDDHRPAQQIVNDCLVGLFTADQLGGDAHIAPAAFQAGFLQEPPLNARQGEEGGPAAAGAL